MKGPDVIPSEFLDVRPKEQMDENKRKTLFRVDDQPTDIPLVDEGALAAINLGYASNERTDSKIVVTSLVLSGIIAVRSEVTMTPSNFGNCVGRLFVIADTQARSPSGPFVPLDLTDVFQVVTAEEAIYGLERIDSDRYVVLCREPIDIPMEVCPVSTIAEVPTLISTPYFDNYTFSFIGGTDEKVSRIGGATLSEDGVALNVGSHFNLDVSQRDGPTVFGTTLYPKVNVANTTSTDPLFAGNFQTQFIPGGALVAGTGPVGVIAAVPTNYRIFDNPDVGGYQRDDLSGASGGLAFPNYNVLEHNIGLTTQHTTVQGKKLIDLEIDFPDGIFIEYERIGVVDRPDVEIFCCLILTGGVYRVNFKYYTGVYFTDDDVWGVNHNVKAGTSRFDPLEERAEDVDPPDWFYDDEEPIEEPFNEPSPKFIPKRSRRSFSQK